MTDENEGASVPAVSLVRHIARERFDIELTGLSEIAPYYLVAALFDPSVVVSQRKHIQLHLDLTSAEEGDHAGLTTAGVSEPQKECLEFASARVGKRVLHLPTPYMRLNTAEDWSVLATCAELPGAVARPGMTAFAFDPTYLITKHLDMDEPDITADLIDLIVRAVLGARNVEPDLEADDLRRDFHALGISYALSEELHSLFDESMEKERLFADLQEASVHFQQGQKELSQMRLAACFQILAEARKRLFAGSIYVMELPHGGILLEREGYGEYDWPEAAAKVLRIARAGDRPGGVIVSDIWPRRQYLLQAFWRRTLEPTLGLQRDLGLVLVERLTEPLSGGSKGCPGGKNGLFDERIMKIA